MRKEKRRIVVKIGVCALIAALAIGGTLAYLTDTDTATNTFTVGKVDIDLTEPNWDPDVAKDLIPGTTVKKNPIVENVGTNDAYIFLEVTEPYANVTIANTDGTLNEKGYTTLFSYTVNDGWVKVRDTIYDTEAGTVTTIYAYATNDGTADVCTAVAKDGKTGTLFDEVTLKNIISNEGLEGTTQTIDIKAYAIQKSNVGGSGDEAKTAPADVWTILNSQMSDTNN